LTAGREGLLLGVRLTPSAPRTAVRGVYGDRLKVSVNAPPEDNRANRQLVEALAGWLDLRRNDVSIEAGHGSRDKVVAFRGIDEPELRTRLTGLVEGDLPAKGSRQLDRRALRRQLLQERERLTREIAELDADLSESLEDSSEESPYDQHMAETAAVTLDREIDLTLQNNARAALAQIDRALHKLENGSYGRCDKCGKAIGEGRLRVAPFATLCVDCKRLEERDR